MSHPGYSSGGQNNEGPGYNNLGGSQQPATERGSRRKKIAGYLKAANDLRQNYQQQLTGSRDVNEADALPAIPGSFPDVAIATHGDEQLVLFPSYCKRHRKEEPRLPSERSSAEKSNDNENGTGDAEFWRREWERFESDKAIVDVDVRGWLYSPHRGAMTRKNRLLVGLARQLSGIPAPKRDRSESREDSPDIHTLRRRHEEHEAMRDQERIDKEAAEILKRGEGEGAIAAVGGYSEQPGADSDNESIYSHRGRRSGSRPTTANNDEETLGPGHLKSRVSWNQPSEMSQAELAAANSNLMTRLMPFLTNPLISTPITIFFYDSKTSQSKTVTTNEAGHFNVRASLDFVPTHVRVLASEHLSATEEVKITEPKGVSIISDVDDTIKHSSIGAGAREIFRNAFIRDLADLTIDGVKEWYGTMYDMGVGIHYVSNSPWQLFPVLVSYFSKAGLPPGSYHLKQYSGMLQGIFEPVAERKKGTLERIMRDFPERKFLLVGDSGEADLEVYTDVVVANPGRILGVFIRDVTTPKNQGFFDAALVDGKLKSAISRVNTDDTFRSKRSESADTKSARPPLPARGMTETTTQVSTGPAMGKLIDWDDEPEAVHEHHNYILPRSNSDIVQLQTRGATKPVLPEKTKSTPPLRPNKPMALRSSTTTDVAARKTISTPSSRGPAPPPPPSRSRQKSDTPSTGSSHPLAQTQSTSDEDVSESGYLATARQKVANAYNSIPPASSYLPGMSSAQPSISERPLPEMKPLPPPRRDRPTNTTSYASNRMSWPRPQSSNDSEDDSSAYPSGASTPREPTNKKLDLWRRRWARAKEVLDRQGVELRSWREGSDVAVDAVKLVEAELREMGVEGYGENGTGKGKSGTGGGEHKVKDLKT